MDNRSDHSTKAGLLTLATGASKAITMEAVHQPGGIFISSGILKQDKHNYVKKQMLGGVTIWRRNQAALIKNV